MIVTATEPLSGAKPRNVLGDPVAPREKMLVFDCLVLKTVTPGPLMATAADEPSGAKPWNVLGDPVDPDEKMGVFDCLVL